MKKIFYIVLVIIILLVVAQFVKNNKQNETMNVEDSITIIQDESGNIIGEEDIIAVDDQGNIEEEAIDVIEENPDETADEQETIVVE